MTCTYLAVVATQGKDAINYCKSQGKNDHRRNLRSFLQVLKTKLIFKCGFHLLSTEKHDFEVFHWFVLNFQKIT